MVKHWIFAISLVSLLISCGADESDRRQPGEQQGFSLIAQSSEELSLRFEINSLFRNIALRGVRTSCEQRLAATENPDAFVYVNYEYVGHERRCARRNAFKQCEVQEFIHSVDCHFKRANS